MEITQKEKEIIAEIIRKRELGKYKWAYLLYEIIQDKRSRNVPFDDIAEWLSKNGLVIKSGTLRKIIWNYKNKITSDVNTSFNTTSNSGSVVGKIISKPAIRSEPERPAENENNIDLSEKLRKKEQELKKKNAGFDQFDNL